MPQNRECDYCGNDVEPGTGTMFVRTDGTVIHYCSSKCEKNADLGREARDLEWTEAGRDADARAAASREAEDAAEAAAEETGDAKAAETTQDPDEAGEEAVEEETEESTDEDEEAENEEAEA